MASRRPQNPVDSKDDSFSDRECSDKKSADRSQSPVDSDREGSDKESGRRSQNPVDSDKEGSDKKSGNGSHISVDSLSEFFSNSESSDDEYDESNSRREHGDDSSDYDPDDVMPRTSSTTAAEMQESNLNALQNIINPLERGLLCFNSLSEILLKIDADFVTPECQNFDNFRRKVQRMERHLTDSEKRASEELERLDEKTETLTVEKSKLEEYRKKQGAKLEKCKTILDKFESKLKKATESSNADMRNLKSAEKNLEKMIDKEKRARGIRNAGIGLLAVPVVGWVVGGFMIGAGNAGIRTAKDEMEEIVERCDEHEFELMDYEEKISRRKKDISDCEEEMENTNSRISEVEVELKDLSDKRKTVSNLQSHMRKVFHHLGLLSGVGNAVESQTRLQILVEIVMKVMHELTPVLTQIIEDRLLPTEGLETILKEIKTNHRQLEANLSVEKNEYY